jgi:L-ascorbate metabolism protein UlaG (beta-lactamase superfamily)
VQSASGTPPFPEHFDGKRFFNPGGKQARGFLDLLRWQLTSRPESSPRFVPDVVPSVPPPRIEGSETRVTLINHSTLLFQKNGMNILTDPVWSKRVSPVGWIGPRRRRGPGVRFEDLPRIDLVLITHNHYDHLDLATLRRLSTQGQSRYVAPVGLARFLQSKGFAPVDELDWGDSVRASQAIVHCVPASHFSARGLFDRNCTLWCGYAIELGGHLIYFAGDTGFGGHFAAIRERFGAPFLALLPIGAYEPRWFMSAVHMGPDEAARAHAILGAKTSIAIHHGTFQLADEAIDTPKRLLGQCAPESFLVLNNGEFVTLAP